MHRYPTARSVPLCLTALRAALGPVVVALALWYPSRVVFAVCLVAAFLSDVFDGIVARRLGVATPNLRRLDSIADSLFYLCAAFAIWHLYPNALLDRIVPLCMLGGLEATRYAFDLARFGREASYHMWSSKLWGIALFAGCYSLLALGSDGAAVSAAVWLGIVADLEGLAISTVLLRCETDVPTLYHALCRRRAAPQPDLPQNADKCAPS